MRRNVWSIGVSSPTYRAIVLLLLLRSVAYEVT